MNPLSSIYGTVAKLRNAVYDRAWRRANRLTGPVVSVGNLSAGGAGKTPFVLLLGGMLRDRGVKFDVLSRGYGRRSRGVHLVEAGGPAATFGDEPLLIARRLQVPVVVGEDRFTAGLFAESKFGPQLHLLDDGFQHRSLARDFDIVMLGPGDAQESLLPVGRLREPLVALCRANAVVIENGLSPPAEAAGKSVWRIARGIALPPLPARLVAFCGVARPERFVEQLRSRGMDVAATRFFRDHHAYTQADVHALLALKVRSGAEAFITTEKDEINLGPFGAAIAPLAVARVTMELADADRCLDAMLKAVSKRAGSS